MSKKVEIELFRHDISFQPQISFNCGSEFAIIKLFEFINFFVLQIYK